VNDALLLQEARSTLSQIEHMLKRIEDAKHHKPTATATATIDKVV